MGRSNAGKNQESAEIKANRAQQTKDVRARDTSISGYNKSVDDLEANPGFRPQDLQAMQAENAGLIGALYGDENEQIRREGTRTGWENDSSALARMEENKRERGRTTALGKNDIMRLQGEQALDTRRMIPGMRFQPANMYNQTYLGLGGQNSSMIQGRMQADSVRPLWADLAMAGISAAGSAAGHTCYIAAALYGGWYKPRTVRARRWLEAWAKRSLFGRVVVWLYARYGKRAARSRIVLRLARPLFDRISA